MAVDLLSDQVMLHIVASFDRKLSLVVPGLVPIILVSLTVLPEIVLRVFSLAMVASSCFFRFEECDCEGGGEVLLELVLASWST